VGVAQVMALGCDELLSSGELVELFAGWPGETFPLQACHPSRHHPPPKARAFIDFCRELSTGSR
jgi:DNA-binding transcriptional LysR family regulator